jgi:hypothetical protein
MPLFPTFFVFNGKSVPEHGNLGGPVSVYEERTTYIGFIWNVRHNITDCTSKAALSGYAAYAFSHGF